jgi:hypothetical protein
MPLFAGTPLFNVLAGAGGAAQGYESAWEAAQKRDLEQQKINIDKQRALSEDLYRQQQLNQNFLSSDPLIGLAKTLNLPPEAFGLKPGEKIDKAYVAAMMPLMLKEQERQQAQAENRARAQALGTAVESTFPLEPVTRPQLGPVMEGAAPLPDVTAPEPNVPLRYRGAIEAAKQGLFEKGATVKDVLAMGQPTGAEGIDDLFNALEKRGIYVQGLRREGQGGGGGGGSPLDYRAKIAYGKEGPSVSLEPPPPEYGVIDAGIRAAWKADGNPGELTPDMPAYKMAFNYMVSGAQPLTEKGVLESKLNALPNVFDAARQGSRPGGTGGPGPGGTPATGPQVTGTPPGTPQPPAQAPERPAGRTLIAPRQAPPGPISPAEITQVSGAIGARKAAEAVSKAIQDPVTADYIGPYAQYRSTKDRRLPTFLGGKDVPPSVVDLEQNLSTLNNYVIHLITGAQVGNSSYGWFGQSEADRIKSELPDQRYPPKEFQQRLQNTLGRMKETEDRIRILGLQGNKDAQLKAQELGFGGGGGGGAGPAAPPSAPADVPPTAGPKGVAITDGKGKFGYWAGTMEQLQQQMPGFYPFR